MEAHPGSTGDRKRTTRARRELSWQWRAVRHGLAWSVVTAAPTAANAQPLRPEPLRSIRLDAVLGGEGGHPIGMTMDATGRVLLSLRRPARVCLLSAELRLRWCTGRDGSGPGEFRHPTGVFADDAVLVWDGQLRRLTRLSSRTGEVTETLPLPHLAGRLLGVRPGGALVFRLDAAPLERETIGVVVAQVRQDGRVVDTLLTPLADRTRSPRRTTWRVRTAEGGGFASAIPFVTRPLVALSPDGSLAVSLPSRRDVLRVWPAPTVVMLRDTRRPVAIPAALRRAARDSAVDADSQGNVPRAAVESAYDLADVPSDYPPWTRLEYTGSGVLLLEDPTAPARTTRLRLSTDPDRWIELPAPNPLVLRSWGSGKLVQLAEGDDGFVLTMYTVPSLL